MEFLETKIDFEIKPTFPFQAFTKTWLSLNQMQGTKIPYNDTYRTICTCFHNCSTQVKKKIGSLLKQSLSRNKKKVRCLHQSGFVCACAREGFANLISFDQIFGFCLVVYWTHEEINEINQEKWILYIQLLLLW
jgi:hypothetical protein